MANLLLKPGSSAMSREAKVMPMPRSTMPSTPSVELRLKATVYGAISAPRVCSN